MSDHPLVEALREYDAVVAGCPANQQSLGEKPCPKCGANSNESCGPEAFAAGTFVRTVRAALASSAPAAGEREQIVAWLRDADKSEHPSDLADAIARGDHLTQSGEMEDR